MAREIRSVCPDLSGNRLDETIRSFSPGGGTSSSNKPGIMNERNRNRSELEFRFRKNAGMIWTLVIPIWSDSDISVTSIFRSPGKPVPAPVVGWLSPSPISPLKATPSSPVSLESRFQSPSLSIPSERDSSIISSIPSSIPSSTAPSLSLSTPSA